MSAAPLTFYNSGDELEIGVNTFSFSNNPGVDDTFTDTYSFTLAEEASVHVQVDEPEGSAIEAILFSIDGTTAQVSLDGITATGFPIEFTTGPLGIGVHSFSVTVTTEGPAGGKYGGELTAVAPVPVPAAVWLFATGLVGLVGLSRRRRQRAL